ncbi:MAG: hypothetical protein ACM34O_05615 [Ignavibacteria bacterium]
MVGSTVSQYKILEKLGGARLHFRFVGQADLSADLSTEANLLIDLG